MNKFFNVNTSKDLLLVGFRLCLGAVFIFSGYVKLFPIEPFELKFVELGLSNWSLAPFIARLFIAGELFLGFMLILNLKPRLTLLTTLSVLVFFTVYLIYDILLNGNEGNCGCFGSLIEMTPLESIMKNLLMIPIAIMVLFFTKNEFKYKPFFLIMALLILSTVLPFILYPIEDLDEHSNLNSEKINYAFPIDLMPDFNVKGKRIDLMHGEYLVSFMSVKCGHCKNAAYKLYVMNKQGELPPIYLVLYGNEDSTNDFIKDTKADFPYYIFMEDNFFKLVGNSMPKIYYLKNGVVKAKFDSRTLSKDALDKTLKNK